MNLRFLPIIFLLIFSACSIQSLTLRAIDPVLDGSIEALFEESDLVLAKTALESDLKLLEGMLKRSPDHSKLLFLATQGYASYALGFVEDDDPQRAGKLYLRAKAYGLRILNRKKQFKSALTQNMNAFEGALQSFSKKDVPALFWTANAWGNYINLNSGDPGALIALPRVEAMMRRVLELDEGYFYGGGHLFFGTILAFKPVMLGGNPEKAKAHFETCLAIGEGKFLLPYVYYAKFYAVNTLDQELFRRLLDTVLSTDENILPEQRLPNAIARKKAQLLLDAESDLF